MNALTQSESSGGAAPLRPALRALVLCDLVDSTRLVERLGDVPAVELLRKHDRIVRALLRAHDGREIDKTDGFLAMFERPVQAVAFALDYQRALRRFGDEEKRRLAARVGIHVGDVLTWDNAPEDVAKGAKPVEVEGLAKPITSRLMQLALPDQILLSGIAYSLAHRAQGELGDRLATLRWRTHGRYRFKGVPDPIPVFEVGEEGHAPLKPPPWSGKAHREVPFWRRPATLGVELAVLLAVVAAPVWYLFRPAPAIAFANRDWVVVGDLRNLTDDAKFDDSLQAAFRIGLEQSRHINVLSDLKARETVRLMRRDPEKTTIDRAVGSEIAIRDGARALILPTVAEIGGRVRVTAEVVDPQTQTTVYSESADGVGDASVLTSLDKVNQQLRLRLGEALATVSGESFPLERVATGNMDALKAYSLGGRAYGTGDMDEAKSMYGQALELDPDFALARVALATMALNRDENAEAARELARVLSHADRLAPRDRLHAEALQASLVNPRLAIEKWRVLSRMYPDGYSGACGYFLWQQANDFAGAIRALEEAKPSVDPYRGTREYLLGTLYLGQEKIEESDRHFSDSVAYGLTRGNGYRAYPAAVRRDFATASKMLEQSRSGGGFDLTEVILAVDQGNLGAARAKIEGARKDAKPGADAGEEKFHRALGLTLSSLQDLRPDDARFFSASSGRIDEDLFYRALQAYLVAHAGDAAKARSLLEAPLAGGDVRLENFPIPAQMRVIAGAEIARVSGDPSTAVAELRKLVDGSELYIAHVVLLDALADAGHVRDAIDEARWLTAHRGRAYAEYDVRRVLVPYNVAQSNLGLLRLAELSIRAGDVAGAEQALAGFREFASRAGAWSVRVGNVERKIRESGKGVTSPASPIPGKDGAG